MAQFHVELDRELINKKLNEGEYMYLSILLKEKFKIKRNDQNEVIKICTSDCTLKVLDDILSKLFIIGPNSEIEIILVKQCFQSLRNCFTSETPFVNIIFVYSLSNILKISLILLKLFIQSTDPLKIDCLKSVLQFLSNYTISDYKAAFCIWDDFSESLIHSLTKTELAHITIILIYNIFKRRPKVIPNNLDFIIKVINLYRENVENTFLVIEYLICKNIVTNFYDELCLELRLPLLENIYIILLEEKIDIPYDLILKLIENFKTKSDCILKTVTDYLENIAPLEVSKLLDCLACVSSREKYLEKLQTDKSLIINCVFLLKSIHEVGKSSDNNFTSIQKLSEITISNTNKTIQDHPGFGFKAALIRLLGNLCSNHKENQTLIRELDCIPLLMDCCNIDARNPLIIQWVILAIRNICEKNLENQAVIAQITKVGVVDSAILREMGLTLHDDGEKQIGIVPLNLNK